MLFKSHTCPVCHTPFFTNAFLPNKNHCSMYVSTLAAPVTLPALLQTPSHSCASHTFPNPFHSRGMCVMPKEYHTTGSALARERFCRQGRKREGFSTRGGLQPWESERAQQLKGVQREGEREEVNSEWNRSEWKAGGHQCFC